MQKSAPQCHQGIAQPHACHVLPKSCHPELCSVFYACVSAWITGQQDPCLGWPNFPWASVIATAAALLTNAIEFVAGQFFGAGSDGGQHPPPGCGHANGHCGHGHSATEPLMRVCVIAGPLVQAPLSVD
jgi:hypothetical protein